MTTRRVIAMGFVITLGLLPFAPASAENEPQNSSATGDAVVGVTGQDEEPVNSAKFQEFRDVPSGFTADRLFLNWTPKEGFHFDLRAFDVSQRDQRVGLSFGKRDLWTGTIAWAQNPRLW